MKVSMNKITISADSFMSFTVWLRNTKGTLIRAKPFMNAHRQECYMCVYMGEKYGYG